MFQTVHTPIKVSAADRFIPRRSATNVELSHYKLFEKPASPNYFNHGTSRYVNRSYLQWKHNMYKERLWSLEAPKSQRILSITDPPKPKSATSPKIKSQHWPVRPRKRPLIDYPDMILDVPDLKFCICSNIIDWSSKGYLASIFEREIYIWHVDDKNPPCQITNTNKKVENTIRWNKSGTHLSMVLNYKGIALWNGTKNQKSHETICPCPSRCTVTSLGWSSNDMLISGCSRGRLTVWNSQLKLLKTLPRAHNNMILTINLSCKETYLATSSTDNTVRIWMWPNIKEHFEILHISPTKNIAWHPWKDSLLATGDSFDGYLSIWNASSTHQLGYKRSENIESCLDSLSWNALSGELVVSYWNHDNSGDNGRQSIQVLSDLNTEVDVIQWHDGRVPYLLWGDGGDKLATAGTDENLCFWNFFGKSKEGTDIYKTTRKNRNAVASNFEALSSFGQTIR